MRSEYVEGHGVPDLVAVYQDPTGDTMDVALAYALGIEEPSSFPFWFHR